MRAIGNWNSQGYCFEMKGQIYRLRRMKISTAIIVKLPINREKARRAAA